MEERRLSLGGVNDADSNDASDADGADVRAADVSETRSGQTQFRHQELSEVQIAYFVQNPQTVLSRHKGGPEANSRRTSVAEKSGAFPAAYIDAHAWQFTAPMFRSGTEALANLGLIGLDMQQVNATPHLLNFAQS